MSALTRCVAVGALSATVVLGAALPAGAAASPEASCIGTIISDQASTGTLDVASYKGLAGDLGFRTFGHFVALGGQEHLGSVSACIAGIRPAP